MKLRRLPEDFIVEEISALHIKEHKDNYRIYLAEKTGINTLSMLDTLARINGVPRNVIGFAGLKDKHAITKQMIAVPSKYELTKSDNKTIKLTFLGYAAAKLRLGDHIGNRFTITVRDITRGEIESIYTKSETLEDWGVPNYFDSQRFGSFHEDTFIGKCIVKKDYENAVRLHCIYGSSSDSNRLESERGFLAKNWPDFSKIKLSDRELASIISTFKSTGDWRNTYLSIKPNLRELYLSAYQSYIWNECVKTYLFRNSNKKYSVAYKAGNLLFYNEALQLTLMTFPTISDLLICDGEVKAIVDKTMSKESITIPELNVKEATGNFLKTYQREIIVKPLKFHISEAIPDDLYQNRLKITLNFELPQGSFATIVTKRLFGQ